MILNELFCDLKSQIIGNGIEEIKGLSYDSRNISKGYIFFALDGTHTSGTN